MRRHDRRLVAMLTMLGLAFAASPASAGKWDGGCPEPRLRLFKAGSGAFTTSIFVHVGHDVIFQLKETAALRGEGFSVEPGGNTVEITFTPVDGEPIPLPPFTVTAVSPMTLRFPVPDTRPILGRLVVGPARFVVKRGATVLVESSKYPTVLPPMNDVHALTVEGGEAEILGTIGLGARYMWIPFSFAGFGEGDPMPACPTATLTPVTAFAVDLTLRKRDGEFVPHATYTELKKTKMFFGDYDLFGLNLYGTKFGKMPKPRRLRNGGFALCALNDTFDLVMMLKLQRRARSRNSEIIPVQRDGSPFVMKLRNISALVTEDLWQLPEDSLGAICPADLP